MNISKGKVCKFCTEPADVGIVYLVTTVGVTPRRQQATKTLHLCKACSLTLGASMDADAWKPILAFSKALPEHSEALATAAGRRRRLPWPPNERERPGFVYVVKADNGVFKIGFTRNINRRMYGLRCVSPMPLTLITEIALKDCVAAEAWLHDRFRDKRSHGEWFTLSDEDVAFIARLKGEPIKIEADVDAANEDEPRAALAVVSATDASRVMNRKRWDAVKKRKATR